MYMVLLLFTLIWSSATSQSDYYAIKLVDGSGPHEGNVYAVNENFYYGPVCDDEWDINDANVACRQLGYSGALRYTSSSYFGSVRSNFSMDNVQCRGTEDYLQDCTHLTTHNCGTNEGAGVICESPPLPDHYLIKLVGGSGPHEGNVYAVNENYYYGPVCDDSWSITDANVACRQLGFSGASRATSSSFFGSVPSKFAMDNVVCAGTEDYLQDCTHLTSDDCGSTEGAGVVCTTTE